MASNPKSENYMRSVQEAIDLVRTGETVATASRVFGIPYNTLRDKMIGRRPMVAKSKYLLTNEEECQLVDWVQGYAERCTYDNIKDKVRDILALRGASTRTKDGRPCRDWIQCFMKRHPEVSGRTTQPLGKERARVSSAEVQQWFTDMKKYLDGKDPSLLNSPDRIYNAVETGFALALYAKKVLEPKSTSFTNNLTNTSTQQLTVLGCASAAGEFLPPLVIYPRKRWPSKNLLDGFQNALMQVSPNGGMNSTIFMTWLRDVFAKSVASKEKPVVLFIDSEASHNIDKETGHFCDENGIVLYGLLPHASNIIQPLGLTVFECFKRKWPDVIKKHLEEAGDPANQTNFASLLKVTWDMCATAKLCLHGFIRSGIYPYNPNKPLSNGDIEASRNSAMSPSEPAGTSGLSATSTAYRPGIAMSARQPTDTSVLSVTPTAYRPGIAMSARQPTDTSVLSVTSTAYRPGIAMSARQPTDTSVLSVTPTAYRPDIAMSSREPPDTSVLYVTPTAYSYRPDIAMSAREPSDTTGQSSTPTAHRPEIAWMKDVFKMTHWIGLGKSLQFANALETGEDNQEEDFVRFKNLMESMPTATHQSSHAGPSHTNPVHPTPVGNKQPITSSMDNKPICSIAQIFYTQRRRNKTNTSNSVKNPMSIPIASISQEYRDYLQKKKEDVQKKEEDKKKKLEKAEIKAKRLKEKLTQRKLDQEKKKKKEKRLARKNQLEKVLREEEKKRVQCEEHTNDDEEEVAMVLESDDEMPAEQDVSES
ncbi:tigger transposable element-derived protein 6-like protein [Elysia marginata]|uniref:Tigger transposable element-derived protein 6-like protein n=1 Tax=Elysia marginata TaxID=1093978 RepID=A0AAV4K107_9GAST|nr:tigger transposable element-derived protein 6-like protein [Elysia marginata]